MMYILVAIVLMSLDQRGHYVPKVRGAMELAFEPVFRLVGWPSQAIQSIGVHSRARGELIAENRQLQVQLLKTAGSTQTQAALVQENQRLRNLLNASSGRAYDFTFSEMIRVDLDPFSHIIWIDHGADKGVVSGQAVIDGLGIVGQVENVLRHSSTVRLISDPDHALPVQINRTGLRSVAFGTGGTDHLIMPNVPLQADIAPGDRVVTSGLGDRFPAGFPVGEVERVQRDGGETFASVYLRPFAALDRGREVLLVKPVVAEPRAEEPGADKPGAAEPEANDPGVPAATSQNEEP